MKQNGESKIFFWVCAKRWNVLCASLVYIYNTPFGFCQEEFAKKSILPLQTWLIFVKRDF
jgi:hypothetical protein